MDEKFLEPYQPEKTEDKIYKLWEESGFFNPDKLPPTASSSEESSGARTPWCTIMPPPNANGRLHAGHALDLTLKDILVRYKRMQGFKTLYVPGADHAGFETQIVYERKLEKEGRTRMGMDPKELYKEILVFTLENKKEMEAEVRKLGISCDWSREKFTLDPDVIKTVHQTFKKMFDEGLVYRGERIVNWCTHHQTSLSEVETEFREQVDPLYYFKYGPFEISTARPETKFGDKYVVMHPDDKRYADYKHGQKIELEWISGPITATVIKDEAIDMEFGTGVMTITPWHDQTDFEIAERHNLDKEQIIDQYGKLLSIAGEFAGQKAIQAREKIVEKLKEKGLLVKIDNEYKHNVKVCYKCERIIEPQIKDQWFVKTQPLAELALNALKDGKISFVSEQFEKVFRHWMNNPIDWNISRQIVWGIPIPAKICDKCKKGFVDLDLYDQDDSDQDNSAKNSQQTCECGGSLHADTDTFDTWFSSGQWPLVTLGYPNGADFAEYYPTQFMETGKDLVFKWIPRMVMFGLYLTGKEPFQTIYLHGMINDEKNKKMSKSKGNVLSPIDLINEFGTDALRMALVVGNTPGADMALSKDKIRAYKKFVNKIWNATRFVLENTSDFKKDVNSDELNSENITLVEEDSKYLEELKEITKDISSDIENYRFYLATEKLYHYFWHDFADIYIEKSKKSILTGTEKEKNSAKYTLYHTLTTCLKLLHPFIPFVTEEIWQSLPNNPNKSLLIVEKWPMA